MMDIKNIRPGVLIELHDEETGQWIPLTIMFVIDRKVECQTLAGEPILTTAGRLIQSARLRPHNGSCGDCGYDAHDGPCVERCCSECGVAISSRCSQHPYSAVHVYRRKRYLAEIIKDKPYPTRETSETIRRDIAEQMRMLRNTSEVRQNRYMITGLERSEILSALENAARLIDSLPSERKRS